MSYCTDAHCSIVTGVDIRMYIIMEPMEKKIVLSMLSGSGYYWACSVWFLLVLSMLSRARVVMAWIRAGVSKDLIKYARRVSLVA